MKKSRPASILGTLVLLTASLNGSTALAQSTSESSLTTTFASNNGFAGNIFDVNVLGESLRVTGLNVNIAPRASGAHVIEVYTREGTFEGSQTNAAGWRLVSSTSVNSAGNNTPTFVDVVDFILPGEETTGVIVFLANYASALMNYTNGTGFGVVASNADLEITGGVGVSDVLFTSVFTSRTWNGTIFYELFLPVTEQMAAFAQSTSTFARRIVSQAGGIAATHVNQGLNDDVTTRFGPFKDTTAPINSWFEVTGYALNGEDMRQTARGFQLGADINVMPNLAVGLSFGRSEMQSHTTDFDVDGVLTFVQPYLGYVNGPLRLDGSLFYGTGTFEQKTEFESGEADATVLAATVMGAYDKVLSDSATLSSMASLSYGSEELKGTSGRLADAETETVRFGQATVGARYTTTTETGLVYAGLHAEYDYGDQDMTVLSGFDDDKGWGGRAEIGAEFLIYDRFEVDFNMSVGGIGKSTTDVETGLMVSMTF